MQKVGPAASDEGVRPTRARALIVALARGSSSARIVALGMTFAFSITVARVLGPHDAGVVFAAVVAVSGAGMVARVGTDLAIIRRGAALHAAGLLTRERLGWHRLLRIAMVNAVAFAALGVFVLQVVVGDRALLPYTIFALSIPLQCLAVLCASLLRASGHAAKGAFAEVGLAQGLAAVAAIALRVVGRADLVSVSVAFTFCSAGVGCWALWSTRTVWQVEGESSGTAIAASTPAPWRELMAMMSSSVLFYALTWSPMGVLVALSTSDQVALYGAAARFPTLIALIPTVQLTGALPLIAAHVSHGRVPEANRVMQVLNRWASLLAFVAMAVLVLGAPWIMRIFGDGFVEAAPVLRVLVIGQMLAVALGPASLVPLVTGFETSAYRALTVTCLVGVSVEALLAAQWGAVGAATGWALAMAAFGLAMAIRLRRGAGIVLYVVPPRRSA